MNSIETSRKIRFEILWKIRSTSTILGFSPLTVLPIPSLFLLSSVHIWTMESSTTEAHFPLHFLHVISLSQNRDLFSNWRFRSILQIICSWYVWQNITKPELLRSCMLYSLTNSYHTEYIRMILWFLLFRLTGRLHGAWPI